MSACLVGRLNDKSTVIKINPFGIYEITWFPGLLIMQFRRMGVFGDSIEQFGTLEKLSPTSTILCTISLAISYVSHLFCAHLCAVPINFDCNDENRILGQ